MRRNLIFFILCFAAHVSFGQSATIDNLRKDLIKHLAEDSLRVNILNQLSYELRDDSSQSAHSYALEAKTISENINFSRGTARAFGLIGFSQWSQSNLSLALKNLQAGIAIADSIHFLQAQADITGYLGMVYSSLGEYFQALQYQLRSREMQHRLNNDRREFFTLNSIGDCYLRLKSYPEAMDFYQKALELGELHKFGQASNYRNIGKVHEAQGELEQALHYYFISKKLSDNGSDRRNKSQVRRSIASIYFKQHKYNLAGQYLTEGIAIAEEGNLRGILRDSYELFSEIEEAQHNLTESLHYYKLFNEYDESIQNDVEASQIASLQLDYETQRKRIELDALKKDAQIQEEDLKQRNVLLIFIAVAFLMIGLFLFYTIRNYRQQKRLSIQLSARNREINLQRSRLASQRDKTVALNEEILSQQNEVILQRDALIQKNKSIEQLHQSVTEANQRLEITVAKRTTALIEQNKRLEEYTQINTTKLMEPANTILNNVNVLRAKKSVEDETILIGTLKKSSENLDKVIRSIGDTLQHGLNAYENQNL